MAVIFARLESGSADLLLKRPTQLVILPPVGNSSKLTAYLDWAQWLECKRALRPSRIMLAVGWG